MPTVPERARPLVLALLLAVGVALMFWSESRRGRVAEGRVVPDVTLQLLDSGSFQPRASGGVPVVLDFWASWCGPCREGLPRLDALARELGDTARIVAVNTENEPLEIQRALRERLKLSLPIAVDGAALSNALQVELLPTTVVLGRDGRVAASFVGAAPVSEIRRAIAEAR